MTPENDTTDQPDNLEQWNEAEPSTSVDNTASDQSDQAAQPEPASSQTPPPSPKRRRLIVGSVIAGVLVLVSAASVLAYNLWYQNPDKVVSDAVANAIRAESIRYTGNLVVESNQSKVTLAINGKSKTAQTGQVEVEATFEFGDEDFTVTSEGIIDKNGDLYFKLSNLRTLADTLLGVFSAGDSRGDSVFNQLIEKLDNQWFRVSAEDLRELDPNTAKQQECVTDVYAKFSQDDAQTNEIANLYKQHRFITLDDRLGSKEINDANSLGYEVSLDSGELKSFVDAANDTQLVKDLQKCDERFELDASDITPGPDANNNVQSSLQVWVSRWGHQFTRVEVNASDNDSDSKLNFIFDPVFNEDVTVSAPKDAISIQELQKEIDKITNSYTQPSSTYDVPYESEKI